MNDKKTNAIFEIFAYENGKPVGIDAVVLSTQHCDSIDQADLIEAVMETIIMPTLPKEWLRMISGW